MKAVASGLDLATGNPSHANEVATSGGRVVAGTKTDIFIKAIKAPAHLPLSGRTMEFDAKGKCVGGY